MNSAQDDNSQPLSWPGLSDTSTDSGRVAEIMGAWYGETARHFAWRYDQWFHPACRDVSRALLGSGDLDEAVVLLGAARATVGRPLEDALADFASLLDALHGRRVLPLDEEALTAALATGFEAGEARLPEATGFAGPAWLQDRLAALFAECEDTAVDPADTYAVLLVDIGLADEASEAGMAVHTAAEVVRSHLALADQVVCLSAHRFAVLVHRHPGLALSAVTLETALRNELPLADVPVSVWVETLQATANPVPFVGALIAAPPPADAEVGGLDVPSAQTGPLRAEAWPARLQHRLAAVWDDGLSLVAAGVVALLLAAGLAQAVGSGDDSGMFLPGPSRVPGQASAPLSGGTQGRTIPTTTTVPPQTETADGSGAEGATAALAATLRPGLPATPVPAATVPPPTGPRPERSPDTVVPTTPPAGDGTSDTPTTTPPTVTPATSPPAEPQLPGKRKGEEKGKAPDGKGASRKADDKVSVTSTDKDGKSKDQPRGRPKTS